MLPLSDPNDIEPLTGSSWTVHGGRGSKDHLSRDYPDCVMIRYFFAITSRKRSACDNWNDQLRGISDQFSVASAHPSRTSLVSGGRQKHRPTPCDLFQVAGRSI